MRLNHIQIIATLSIFLQIILEHSSYLSFFQLIIIFAWLIFHYGNISNAFFFIIIGGFILEIFTFGQIGLYSLSFSLTVILLYLLKNNLNLVSEDNKMFLSSCGFIINLIIYTSLNFIIKGYISLGAVVVGLILSLVIFFLFIRFIKIKYHTYET